MKAAADTRDDLLRTLPPPPRVLHGTPVHSHLGLPPPWPEPAVGAPYAQHDDVVGMEAGELTRDR